MTIPIDRRRFTLSLVAAGAAAGLPLPAMAQSRVISGSVTYRERMALPPSATLDVRVVDLGDAGETAATIASTTLSDIGQVPVAFEIEVTDASSAGDGGTLALSVSIEDDGEVLFSMAEPMPLGEEDEVGEIVLTRDGGVQTGMPPEITGAEWSAVEIEGQPIDLPRAPTLTLNEDGTAGGHGGCNRYFATVTVSGDAITFSEIGSTFMACEESVMATEQAFLGALVRAVSFRMEEGRLELLDEGEQPLVALLVTV